MIALFGAQFAVPLALLLWMALAPPRSASLFCLQVTRCSLMRGQRLESP